MAAESNPFRLGLPAQRAVRPAILVLFGARGDLSRRKILPAIAHLAGNGLLPPQFAVLGIGRGEMTDQAFRNQLRGEIDGSVPAALRDAMLESTYYAATPGRHDEDVEQLTTRLGAIDRERGTQGNRLFYLSTPPSAFFPIIELLDGVTRREGASDAGFRRIIVEKPFGRDLDSARALNRRLLEVFPESSIYRIDHYLGKETVQNVLVLRFANAIFEPLWNRRYVDHVQITVAEALGVEGRGGYYEESGALRDMVQNHLLQLVCLVAMEPPAALDAESIRDERRKVLRSIRPIRREDVAQVAVRGQYAAGSILGRAVPGYRDEEGVSGDSRTETYAALRLEVDNWRWAGVPFFLRTGKRLPKKLSEVAIVFKDIPHRLFDADRPPRRAGNVLSLRIQPDEGIALRFGSKVPGHDIRVRPVKMDFQYGSSFGASPPDAYQRLLLDALLGDPTLFIRGDVVEEAWKLVMPILEEWHDTAAEMPDYAAGSYGPKDADALLEAHGVAWRRL